MKFLIKGCFHANPPVKTRTTQLIAVVLQFDVMKLNTGINYAAETFDKCIPNMFGINKVNKVIHLWCRRSTMRRTAAKSSRLQASG